MIIAYSNGPKRLLLRLREYIYPENVLIYPEFFDSKRALITRNYSAYFRKIKEWRSVIIVALWPDYFYASWPCRYDDIMWIFPLHHKKELERVPNCITFIGYASQPSLRDYSLEWFMDYVPRPWWYLGANSRELYEAFKYNFDGMDVHSLSIPRWGYTNSIENADKIAKWLIELAQGRILTKNDLFYGYKPLDRYFNAQR